jgi:hypothetical protein
MVNGGIVNGEFTNDTTIHHSSLTIHLCSLTIFPYGNK